MPAIAIQYRVSIESSNQHRECVIKILRFKTEGCLFLCFLYVANAKALFAVLQPPHEGPSATPPWQHNLGNNPHPSVTTHPLALSITLVSLPNHYQPFIHHFPPSISSLLFLWFPMVHGIKITIHNLLAVHTSSQSRHTTVII